MLKPLISLLFSLTLASSVFGQATSTSLQLENLQGQTPMAWVTQRFLIHKEQENLDLAFGLETQSAVFGDYGGFYVFGLHGRTGIELPMVYLWSGLTLATGGGAGAPDGDGLMYRIQAQAEVPVSKSLRLGLGYSFLDFPSGDIASSHISFGLHYTMPYSWNPQQSLRLYNGSIAILGGVFVFDDIDASRIDESGYSIYNGVRFTQSVSTTLDLDIQLGASAIGATDGFMDYKAGFTIIPFSGSIQPLLRGQLGSGGGGGVHTGGGISTLVGAGLRMYDRIELTANYWDALHTEMGAPFVEVAYRMPFESNFAFLGTKKYQIADKLNLNPQQLVLVIGNRTNLAQGFDRNGLEYKPMSSIFLGAKIPVNEKLYAAGETLWAATGGYGAYAEGMFGVYYSLREEAAYALGMNASVVAAGGGGIDVGRGTAIALGAHYTTMMLGVPTTFLTRYKHFGEGAYNPIVVGVQFEPIFKVFKR